MSNRQGKCPGCGLVNPPEAFECRCCGFVLRAGAQARPSSNAYAKPSYKEQSRGGLPFGSLIVFVLLVMGGAGLWHTSRENAEREARFAEAVEKAEEEDDATPSKRPAQPSPGDRPGSDAGRRRRGAGKESDDDGGVVGMIERATQEQERDVYGEKEAKRAAEARARAARKKQAESSWPGR